MENEKTEILKIESENPIPILNDDDWYNFYGNGFLKFVTGEISKYECPPKRRYELDLMVGFDDSFLQKLFTHMSKGKSYESFGGRLGITSSKKTLWEKNIMEWRLTKEFGEAACREFWEDLGIGLANGDKIGNASVYNTTMQALFRESYGKQQEVRHEHSHGGNVVLKIEAHASPIPLLSNDEELDPKLYNISDV